MNIGDEEQEEKKKPKNEGKDKASNQVLNEPEVVNIDAEEASKSSVGSTRQPPSLDKIETEPYNHQKQQEIARRYIAYALVALIASLILFSFIYLYMLPLSTNTKAYVDNLASILQILFSPLITLTATAIGYYFGSNAKESK